MNFRFSQGELWTRSTIIEAPTFEEAMAIYRKYQQTGEEPDNMIVQEPEYVDDMDEDLIVFDENFNTVYEGG